VSFFTKTILKRNKKILEIKNYPICCLQAAEVLICDNKYGFNKASATPCHTDPKSSRKVSVINSVIVWHLAKDQLQMIKVCFWLMF